MICLKFLNSRIEILSNTLTDVIHHSHSSNHNLIEGK